MDSALLSIDQDLKRLEQDIVAQRQRVDDAASEPADKRAEQKILVALHREKLELRKQRTIARVLSQQQPAPAGQPDTAAGTTFGATFSFIRGLQYLSQALRVATGASRAGCSTKRQLLLAHGTHKHHTE